MRIKSKLISIYLIGAVMSIITIVFVLMAYSSIREDFSDVMNQPIKKIDLLKKIEKNVMSLLASTSEVGLMYAEKVEEGHINQFQTGKNQNEEKKELSSLQIDKEENNKSQFDEEIKIEKNEALDSADKLNLSVNEYEVLINMTSEEEKQSFLQIKNKSNELIKESLNIIQLKEKGLAGVSILERKDVLESIEDSILTNIESLYKLQISELREKQEHVNTTISNSTKNTIFIFLSAVVLTIVFGFLVSNSINKSLNKLKEASYEIGNGNLDFILDTEGNDEVSDLAKDFQKMTIQLKDSQNEILSSKNFVENIFSSMAEMVLVVEEDGTIKKVNDSTLNLLGFTEEEIIGKPIKFLTQQDSFLSKEEFEFMLKHKELVEVEKQFFSKDGKSFPVLISSSLIQGKNAFAVIVAKDITKLKKDEQKLKDYSVELEKSNKEYEQLTYSYQQMTEDLRRSGSELINAVNFNNNIMNSMVDFVVVVDLDLKIQRVNPATLRLNGYEEHELIGNSVNMLMADRPFNEKGIQALRKRGFVNNLEKLNRCKDGSIIPITISMSVLKDEQGEDMAIVCVGKDITENIKARKSIEESNEKLRQSNRELQDFAYVASHDLQEPLRKIQAFGDRLTRKYTATLGDEGNDYLQRMIQAAGRMQRLINDLLTFSRITTKAQPFQLIDVKKVTEEVISDLEVRIEETKAEVEIGELPQIEADPVQMRQLMQNLIGNALKFSQSGKAPIIKVYSQEYFDKGASFIIDEQNVETTGSAEKMCQIVVQDNGIGFDEKYLNKIFTVFQRLHGRNEYEGSGVGLAVCRKIVERHGGNITAKSKEGEGSTFLITLPIIQTQEDINNNENGL